MFVELRASSFQSLEVYSNIDTPMNLKSAVSPAILRCGSSLTTLYVTVLLSDAAIQHITQLPKLTTWFATDEPPRVSDSSPSDVFTKLTTFYLPEIHWSDGFLFSGRAHVVLRRDQAHTRR